MWEVVKYAGIIYRRFSCRFCDAIAVFDHGRIVQRAVLQASQEKICILIFPECALTGYPPHNIAGASRVDFEQVTFYCSELDRLAKKYQIYIAAGAIMSENNHYYNSAMFLRRCREGMFIKKGIMGMG